MGKNYIRVDDRLIHGQTIVAWCPTWNISEIIAVDDISAKNPTIKSIIMMGVPKKYRTNIVTIEELKLLINQESETNRLIIVKFPKVLTDFIDLVSDCNQIVLGNLAKRDDTIYKVGTGTDIFYLSEEDVLILDKINKNGFEVLFQQLPSSSKIKWETFKTQIKWR